MKPPTKFERKLLRVLEARDEMWATVARLPGAAAILAIIDPKVIRSLTLTLSGARRPKDRASSP